ncbi:hypothetical protein PCC8801_2605 [Rippkaea orientalis PCC 8801]|uniref:Uncharacterized protein n=1 Tax=Rippkaea orientalis (strain PCC 8801 / RF-1) TaxID=41431 RepID=B7K4V3_RIPO1|nr:hypothetical protein [Rippkaea orientalis]ACK66609.1 hypothetical protein PCC8801_2605 [Rippkaea orientalis PCC 8801]
MTISSKIETPQTLQNEVIFPQGEFWSDEHPLESNLYLKKKSEKLAEKLHELGINPDSLE